MENKNIEDYDIKQCEFENTEYISDNIIKLDTRNISSIFIDEKLFKDGVKNMSTLCGQISALCSVGITPSMALSYLNDKFTSEEINKNNLEISKLNANANIESAKYTSDILPRYTI